VAAAAELARERFLPNLSEQVRRWCSSFTVPEPLSQDQAPEIERFNQRLLEEHALSPDQRMKRQEYPLSKSAAVFVHGLKLRGLQFAHVGNVPPGDSPDL
jgi:hypothetical protein